MRFVQVTVPTGKRETVLAALDEEGVDYVVTDETSGREYNAVVSVPLPTGAVEPVLEAMRAAGVERDAYTVVIAAETVESERFDRLEERYEEEENKEGIAREELRARAEDFAPSLSSFVLLTTVSSLVATAGLLLDSPATVVGSMVIAPLIGPAMAAGVGTVLDEDELVSRGVRLQVVGVVATVAAAALFAGLLNAAGVVPPGIDILAVDEIRERVAPDVLTLPVALGAGVAGAHSLRSGVSTALVGVMIAVALVPPAAVVGIGIAWGLPAVALGAAVLVAVNVLSINLATLVTLWYAGYRPDRLFRTDEARSATLTRIVALTAAVALLTLVLGGVTLVSYQQGVAEQTVREQSRAAVADVEDAELVSVSVTFEPVEPDPQRLLSPAVREVTVTVSRPEGVNTDGLADRVADRLSTVAPGAVVEVRYVAVDRADTPTSPARAPTARPATAG
ncbi:TIGR00341 family protein [Halobacteriales archaeon SW_7_71_33]|nr:MAG: TIGR00341 family protein [Halobacteriales archaeon SW_7_71_33]